MTFSKSILTSLIFLFTLYIQAQKVDLNNFDGINVAAGLNVNLVPGNSNYADVEMISGDREDVKIKVQSGTLRLKAESGFFGKSPKANITVYYTDEINSIDVSSGSRLKSSQLIKSKRLELDASSGASCSVSIDVDELNVDVSSGARITISGDADAQAIDVSSGAKYSAKELISEYADISASSGANADIYCSKRIKADASSGGQVYYYGSPKDQDLDAGKWSGGNIKAK